MNTDAGREAGGEWHIDPDNDCCFFVDGKRFHLDTFTDGDGGLLEGVLRDRIIADHEAAARAEALITSGGCTDHLPAFAALAKEIADAREEARDAKTERDALGVDAARLAEALIARGRAEHDPAEIDAALRAHAALAAEDKS